MQLRFARAGHDDHSIAQGFATGFIKKRNVSQKKIAGFSGYCRRIAPLLADARMQNLLKRRFFFRVGKHYGAKRRPIQVSALRKNRGAKAFTQQLLHFRIVIRQFTRRLDRH